MKKQNVEITIGAEFGSKFQEDFGKNTLKSVITAWANFLDSSHKKNKITWIIHWKALKLFIVLFLGLTIPLQVHASTVTVRYSISIPAKTQFHAQEVAAVGTSSVSSVPKGTSWDFMTDALAKVPSAKDWQVISQAKHSSLIAYIYGHESTYGKYDVCRSKGMANGFGYNEYTGHSPTCYKSFSEVEGHVDRWIDDKIRAGMSLARINCLYVRGVNSETCNSGYKLLSDL